MAASGEAASSDSAASGRGAPELPVDLYEKILRSKETRDPRGFILSADQPDFPTAIAFINTLIKAGVTVYQAAAAFQAAGKSYPAGSLVVKTNQAFRPHVLDMFEPQDHPHDFRYAGGPPIPPYDTTGWTLAFQMGVQFDRLLEDFDGPFEKVIETLSPPPGKVTGASNPAGYLISHRVNRSFTLVNRLLKRGEDVYWLKSSVEAEGKTLDAGTIYVPHSAGSMSVLQAGAKELGVDVQAIMRSPDSEVLKLKPARIGLFDQYGGTMPSGWTRYVLEQFEFPYEVVYPGALDGGDLKNKIDVLVFADGGIRQPRAGAAQVAGTLSPDRIPADYRDRLGRFTTDKTFPQVKTFIESGGTVITVGSSTALGDLLSLPVKNALTEKTSNGTDRPIGRDKFYVPGSVLRATVDNTHPLAYGIGDTVDIFFQNSPVFRLGPDAAKKGVKAVAWFSGNSVLRSGWAWGEQYLDGSVGIAEAAVGEGKVFLMGPDISFRGQPHGTFKFLFNGIHYGGATPAKLP
jgi:hypothetical protein